MKLQTKRLYLRPFQTSDYDELVNILSNDEVTKFINGPYDSKRIKTQLNYWISDFQKDGYGFLAFIDKKEKKMVGYGGFLHQRLFSENDNEPKSYIELGYCIARPYWGLGIATEAISFLKDYGLESLHFSELIAIIHEDNIGSLHVARKIGMSLLKKTMVDGNPCHVYHVKNHLSHINDKRV